VLAIEPTPEFLSMHSDLLTTSTLYLTSCCPPRYQSRGTKPFFCFFGFLIIKSFFFNDKNIIDYNNK
jgi:hypothetical protein